MKLISMAYTTPAYLSGDKIVTRRYWKDKTAMSYEEGERCQVWSASPRFKGEKVGELVVLRKPYLENLNDASEFSGCLICKANSMYEKEGFEYLDNEDKDLLNLALAWVLSNDKPYVVEFEADIRYDWARKKYQTPENIGIARTKLMKNFLNDKDINQKFERIKVVRKDINKMIEAEIMDENDASRMEELIKKALGIAP